MKGSKEGFFKTSGKIVLVSLFTINITSCGFFQTENNLQTDKAERFDVTNGLLATYWRGAKISLRSLPTHNFSKDTDFDKLRDQQAGSLKLGSHLSAIYDWEDFLKGNKSQNKSLSASELLELAQEVYQMSEKIKDVDEDSYPTIMEVVSNSREALNNEPLVLPESWNKSMEHWVFAVLMEAKVGIGSWKTYELDRIKSSDFNTTDLQVFSALHKGVAQLRNEWFYLAEESFTYVLLTLDNNNISLLPETRSVLASEDDPLSAEDSFRHQMQAVSYLLRGFSRHQTEKPELEQKALEDINQSVKSFSKAGVDNELVWLAESYIYIKGEKVDEAIISLTKLESSSYLSSKEKQLVSQAKKEIKNRNTGAALNFVTDKIVMYKLGLNYTMSYIDEIQWLKLLEKTPEGRKLLLRFKELEKGFIKAKKYISIDEISRNGKNLLNDYTGG